MTTRTIWRVLAIAALCTLAGGPRAMADPRPGPRPRTRVALSRTLTTPDGHQVEATVVEVTYEPGGSSPPHSHPCPVMVHVIEGAIRTRVKGEPEAVYRAGQAFHEAAGGLHEFSANASDRSPARFLAIFVCDRQRPLTVPPPAIDGGM